MTTALVPRERSALRRLEKVIEKGQAQFIAVGQALLEIRDGRLYRATHRNFESYCRERWDFNRQHAHRLITASQVVRDLSPRGRQAATTERLVRPLAALPAPERARVFDVALDTSEDDPTAEDVEEVTARALAGLSPEDKAEVLAADEEQAAKRREVRERREARTKQERDLGRARTHFAKLSRALKSLDVPEVVALVAQARGLFRRKYPEPKKGRAG